MTIPLVFQDKQYQRTFNQKGYVVIPSLLANEAISSLSDLFSRYQGQIQEKFHTSHFSTDEVYKKEAHDLISEIVFKAAKPLLNDYKPIFGNFMIKNPDPTFSMDLHSDWTYVQEPDFCSIAIWVPLVDVDESNGCFGVISGSHKLHNPIRGPLIRQSARKDDPIWQKRYGQLLPMKAGDAVIYNHSLLHFSPPNRTSTVRPAVNLSLVPSKVPCIHYCMPEGSNQIEMYSVENSDFFIHYDNFQKPKSGKVIKTLPPEAAPYIDSQMKWFWRDRFLSGVKSLVES